MPPQLSLSDLTQRTKNIDRHREESYDAVLSQCHNRIKRASEMGQQSCVYKIPSFLIGLPLIQIGPCSAYIKQALLDNGLYAEFSDATTLFICWDPVFIQRHADMEAARDALHGSGSGSGSNGLDMADRLEKNKEIERDKEKEKKRQQQQRRMLPPIAQRYSKIDLPF